MDVNQLKNVGQQLYIESRSKSLAERHSTPGTELEGGEHT